MMVELQVAALLVGSCALMFGSWSFATNRRWFALRRRKQEDRQRARQHR